MNENIITPDTLYDLLNKICIEEGDERFLSLLFVSLISADNNLTPEDEAENNALLKKLYAAIEMFQDPPPVFLKRKAQIAEYLGMGEVC